MLYWAEGSKRRNDVEFTNSDPDNGGLSRLALPRSALGSHTVNSYSRRSGQTRRTLPFGTARVVVHSTFVLQSIYGAIQEYAGIARPEWVDL